MAFNANWYCYIMSTLFNDMSGLPFNSVSESAIKKLFQTKPNDSIGSNAINVHSNNDCLVHIDPDIQIDKAGLDKQCKYYDEKQFNTSFSGQRNISMIHLNIRSSKKNLGDFLCSIGNLNMRFSFIILTEIWCNNDTARLNAIPGYAHLHDTRDKRIGGGVSLYVDNNISYKKRPELKFDKTYFESCFIEVDKSVFLCKCNVIIAAVYKPPNVSVDIFNTIVERILNIIQKERKYAYFLGDFNINTIQELQSKSTLTHDFINLMSTYSYRKLINVPTRVVGSSSTLIDNIYSNFPNVYESGESGVLCGIRSTDHMPIFTIRSIPYIIKGEKYKNKRNFSKQNISNLRKMLKAHNWDDVYNSESAQLAFSKFIQFIIHAFNKCCPMESIKINYKTY